MPDPLYSARRTIAYLLVPSDTQTIQGPVQANGKPQPYTSGIHALTDGMVVATFKDMRGATPVSFPVIAGVYYPYALSFLHSGTVASLMGLD
jgi:hypothetical protein